jgi:hypothetical protein
MSLDNHSRTLVLRAGNIDKQFILCEGHCLLAGQPWRPLHPNEGGICRPPTLGFATCRKQPRRILAGFEFFLARTPHLGQLLVQRPGTRLA